MGDFLGKSEGFWGRGVGGILGVGMDLGMLGVFSGIMAGGVGGGRRWGGGGCMRVNPGHVAGVWA